MEDKELFDKSTSVNGSYLMYKGKPLVREDNMICYGYMEDKYVLQLTIMTAKAHGDKEVPDKILIQIVNTDKNLPSHERIAKQDMKSGLAEAFELGLIWLERLNA